MLILTAVSSILTSVVETHKHKRGKIKLKERKTNKFSCELSQVLRNFTANIYHIIKSTKLYELIYKKALKLVELLNILCSEEIYSKNTKIGLSNLLF